MYKFDFELDEFQKEAVKCIDEGKSVVVCAPTGAGKTCIAEHAIHRALEEGTRVFYTTPLKALSNQKYYDFSFKYGEENVGLLTGDTSINRDAQVVVMTTEVFRNMLYGTNLGALSDNLKNVKYVILDEVHYMNDEQRGTVWEESIIYCPTEIQLVALSATVANSQQLTDWINTVHSKTELIYTDFRPVPLRFYYYDSSKPHEILPLLTPSGGLNKKIRPERHTKYNRKKQQKSPVKNVISVLQDRDMLPAIYFTFSRKKCDEQMMKCSELTLVSKDEQAQIKQIIDEYLDKNPYLENNKHIEYLIQGCASHHAGLLPGWKVLVEKLFQKGLIKVVFSTETLAAGINMPARSTVISSVSKRTDAGHRMLTANEFLQMSGRAGRRGMDEIGYVTVVGTEYQSPEEVAQLVLSKSNPLESRFTPTYSMVMNLLQRFSKEEAKELILKSFGYFSSTDRLKPLYAQKRELENALAEIANYKCASGISNEDFQAYIKAKETYVAHQKILTTLKKQNKHKKKEMPAEYYEFKDKVVEMQKVMFAYPCNGCNRYKKHIREIELNKRYTNKLNNFEKEIEFEKDIYWRMFERHANLLESMGYSENFYPNEKGKIISALRTENELFLAEIILSGVLNELPPSELASVVCAITTEELRADICTYLPVSRGTRKALNKIKEIRRSLFKKQRDFEIDTDMYINSFYSPLIEYWANGGEWAELIEQVDMGEGDIVRAFKRTVDVLRQFTLLNGVSPTLIQNAKDAIYCIMREPLDID